MQYYTSPGNLWEKLTQVKQALTENTLSQEGNSHQMEKYTHGYSALESDRLHDQATTLTDLLHNDTLFPSGHLVLEGGCGVGSQTLILARNSPGARYVAVDISRSSVRRARDLVNEVNLENIRFQVQDINHLSYRNGSFDHVFICFVLEHMVDPVSTLVELRRVLKSGGTITAIEGDHGSAYFYPDSEAARRAIQCQVQLQKSTGGNANIGRSLHPLMTQAGFKDPFVTPRTVYADDSRPDLVEGFILRTFTAMIAGIKDRAIGRGLISEEEFNRGIRDLQRTAEGGGTFCYTFFKGQAVK
jgi:ubiquinone/menaquinone biosynthesis C-methylase UbiE